MLFRTLFAVLLITPVLPGQATKSKPAPAKPAATRTAPAKAPSVAPIDQVKQMVKSKLPDETIVAQISKLGSSIKASPEDLIAIRALGASDDVIVALSMNAGPSDSAPAAPAVAAKAPAPASSAPASAARTAPAAASAPAPAAPAAPSPSAAVWNSDLSAIPCTPSSGSGKRILAIDEFDYGTVTNSVQAIFGTNVDIGKGIQALLVKRLAEAGTYRVVERRNLAKVMAEQDLGASNRARQGPNARIGRIMGADAILMGTITIFGRDDKRKGVDLGGYVPSVFGRTRVGVGEATAVVAISYRLVDAETSEVIDQGEARGESSRKGSSLSVAGVGNRGGGFGSTDMTSTNFAETIVGEATTQCINKLSTTANSRSVRVKQRSLDVEARIADISGDRVYLAAGEVNGVSNCDRFEIFRVRKEILDPVTKEVIDLDLEKTGDLLITEVRERVAIGAYNGAIAPAPNMLARKVARK